MSVRKTLPTMYIEFPQRCARCGNAPDGERTVSAVRGVDILLFRWGLQANISIPTCRPCRRRRSLVGLLLVFACLLAFFGLIAAGVALYDAKLVGRIPALSIFGGGAILLLYAARNWTDGWADRLMVGIHGVSLTEDPPAVTLLFSNPAYAEEVERLTTARRDDARQAAREYLAAAPSVSQSEARIT